MQRAMIFRSPWGWMGIAESPKGIQTIVLPKRSKRAVESDLKMQSIGSLQQGESAQLEETRRQLLDYLAGRRNTFDVPLDLSQGTSFQRQVWRTLQRVPYGKLRSYQWIAARVGGRHYARAVGNAVGANPLPIVVPCHRIVAHDASLGGFSGGLSIKRKLLSLEGTLRCLKSGH
ncbi:MAG TPA: methylated-DNA--[protein]-cysteine S-methyltransferase [Nitrospira sp.]|nr:methylated-DNA--[protein]-cysteine S-methyltransferase [Nitrospira sp.]